MNLTEPELTALRTLLDKQEIHDLLMRYCRASDRNDIELLATTFWPEALDEHGPYTSTTAEMLARRRALADDGGPMRLSFTQHNVCNEYVTIDGDTACSETYFVSYHGCEKEGVRQLYVFGGRYVDRVERRGREWRYLHRLVVCDWEGMQPVTAGFWWPSPWARGLPSTDDPVYRVWPQTADDAPPAVP